ALDTDSRIAFYAPQSQSVGRSLFVVVRSNADPEALTPAVVQAVHRVDPSLPIYHARTLQAVVARSIAQHRFTTPLLPLFACSALALGVIGVYGMMACIVAQASRDLGVRMALGASPRMIRWWVLRRAAGVTVVGVAAGLAGAIGVSRSMRGLMPGIDEIDVS